MRERDLASQADASNEIKCFAAPVLVAIVRRATQRLVYVASTLRGTYVAHGAQSGIPGVGDAAKPPRRSL